MECKKQSCVQHANVDPSACGCLPCPNAPLCGTYHGGADVAFHRGTCTDCAVNFGRALSFVKGAFECAICLEPQTAGMHHPSGCTHVFCVDCVRRLVWPCTAVTQEAFGWTEIAADETEEECDIRYWRWAASAAGTAYHEQRDLLTAMSCSDACPLCRAPIVADWVHKRGAWAEAT